MKYQYKLLVNALKLVALPYEEQKSFLPDFVGDNIQNDVVSDFDIAFEMVPKLMDKNMLSYLAVKKILRCYILIGINVATPSMTLESFKSHKLWESVRLYAREALQEMGESPTLPDEMYFDD